MSTKNPRTAETPSETAPTHKSAPRPARKASETLRRDLLRVATNLRAGGEGGADDGGDDV